MNPIKRTLVLSLCVSIGLATQLLPNFTRGVYLPLADPAQTVTVGGV